VKNAEGVFKAGVQCARVYEICKRQLTDASQPLKNRGFNDINFIPGKLNEAVDWVSYSSLFAHFQNTSAHLCLHSITVFNPDRASLSPSCRQWALRAWLQPTALSMRNCPLSPRSSRSWRTSVSSLEASVESIRTTQCGPASTRHLT